MSDPSNSMWHLARLLVMHALDTESEKDVYHFEEWEVVVQRPRTTVEADHE